MFGESPARFPLIHCRELHDSPPVPDTTRNRMFKKTRLNGVGVVGVLSMAVTALMPAVNAATVQGQDLTWYSVNDFAESDPWTPSTNPAYVSESNPGGGVLANSSGASVDTTIYGSFATQTLLNAGDSVSIVFQVSRSVVASSQAFLIIGLGYDGGTPISQNYLGTPAPTGDDITFTSYLNSAIYFTDTDVHEVEILVSRWALAPTFFRQQIFVDGQEIAITNPMDGFYGDSYNPTSQFNQASVYFNWGGEGPNMIGYAPVPEPSTVALLAAGLSGAVLLSLRNRRRALGTQ